MYKDYEKASAQLGHEKNEVKRVIDLVCKRK
jgi:hypothetical protein